MLGDSWTDDLETKCTSWPTIVARRRGLSSLCVGFGGAVTSDLPWGSPARPLKLPLGFEIGAETLRRPAKAAVREDPSSLAFGPL